MRRGRNVAQQLRDIAQLRGNGFGRAAQNRTGGAYRTGVSLALALPKASVLLNTGKDVAQSDREAVWALLGMGQQVRSGHIGTRVDNLRSLGILSQSIWNKYYAKIS